MKFPLSLYRKEYTPLIIFSIAMGFLEAIVVVYIREIYYPQGFQFPLKEFPQWVIVIELIREICTLLMLGTVAWISGQRFLQRFSVFIFIFGIWDIFYYIALKLFLNWPESILTWDILFLIPITWVGPVLAPVICSIVMITMALLLDHFRVCNNASKFHWKELILLFTGAFVIYFTFTYDFGMIIIKNGFLTHFFSLAENPDFLSILSSWEPDTFNWGIFSLGMGIVFLGMILFVKREEKR